MYPWSSWKVHLFQSSRHVEKEFLSRYLFLFSLVTSPVVDSPVFNSPVVAYFESNSNMTGIAIFLPTTNN